MTAYLEMNLAGVGILDVPDDVNLVVFQAIGDGQVEMEGIDLQRLFIVMQGKGHLVLRLADQRKLLVAGKAVARQVILLAIHPIGIVIDAAHQREQDRRMAGPLGASLPHILPTLAVSHTLELGSFLADADGQLLIL